jgi:hypothetical protein
MTACVIFMTLTACTPVQKLWRNIHHHTTEYCNSRAYIQQGLNDYINKRFGSKSHARLAVIPFTVPANLAATRRELPGIGNTLAWRTQAWMLENGSVPIVEVLPREDWPGKRDEFFAGNHGAIRMARDAGFDLVLVGFVSEMTSADTLSASAKIIETESGITVWYGTVDAVSARQSVDRNTAWLGLTDRKPAELHYEPLLERLAKCIVKESTRD